MKFGRLVYRYTGNTIQGNSAIYNIGDNFQSFAIQNIYHRLGINEDDIIDINASEMENYTGEYVVILLAGYGSHYKRWNQFPTSEKIIPVFFSFEMSDKNCDDIVPYLRKNEPIGCRDENTMKLLRSKGIEAYISGCITLTLPKREKEPVTGKVFFVDIPSNLEKYIPIEYKNNCEYISQEGIIEHTPMTEEERIKIDEHARRVLQKYKDEATLVVTSRLHAAVPCIALGIPVILTINNIDSRFSWIDKLIPLYDSEHFCDINWEPKPIEIEDLKERMIKIVCNQINKKLSEKKDIYDLSSFWENRTRVEYNSILYRRMSCLREKYSFSDVFSYIIWGAGVHGKLAYDMISEQFPNAELLAVVDNYMEGKLFDCKIIKPYEVKEMAFDFCLITTHPGRFEAVQILNEMGKINNLDWCYFISKDIPEEKEK